MSCSRWKGNTHRVKCKVSVLFVRTKAAVQLPDPCLSAAGNTLQSFHLRLGNEFWSPPFQKPFLLQKFFTALTFSSGTHVKL